MILPMEKSEFMKRLLAAGTSQAQLATDLGIDRTTIFRWKEAPGYAVAYLFALETMSEAQVVTWRYMLQMESIDDGEPTGGA